MPSVYLDFPLVDSTSGFVEIFKGVRYEETTRGDASREAKYLMLLWYRPGHYQAIVKKSGGKPTTTLPQLKQFFDKNSIEYVESPLSDVPKNFDLDKIFDKNSS